MKKIYVLLLVCSNFLFAKDYVLNLIVDESSSKYINEIKQETKSLFSSNDKLKYNIKICENNCSKVLSKKEKSFLLVNIQTKIKVNKNSYLITYNTISNNYDKNKVIRTTALGIYEYLKEDNISRVIHLKNEILIDVQDDKNINTKNVLELKDIFSLALKNNINIRQNQNTLKLDKLQTEESKSLYKPKLDFSSNFSQIDSDRAKYSNGLHSQGSFDIGIKLSQVIYSNKIIQNIKIKRLLEQSNSNNIKSKNDEVLYNVLLTYLNVIKANKYNEIIKIKQNFIKQNLNFSKQRVEVGVQDRSDVYRWQSELANVNIELSNSKQKLNKLKIELANLIQVDKSFSFIQYDMNSEIFKILDYDAIKYISNKKVQDLFLSDIIFSHSKLKQIDKLINVKKEELQMNKSSRYLPSVVFNANAKKTLDRTGQGSNAKRYWDDEEYQAVLNLSLPIYEGGLKSVNIQKNKIELINLKLQYNEIKNLIEKNVEQDYDSLLKSYEKIFYAKTSLKFSEKNYELISDKYKNGKENIIALLDAQNEFIVSKLNENISIIDYLVDVSSIYFFSGKIDILLDKSKKNDVEEKILNAITNTKNEKVSK